MGDVLPFPRYRRIARYLGVSHSEVERWAAGQPVPERVQPRVTAMCEDIIVALEREKAACLTSDH